MVNTYLLTRKRTPSVKISSEESTGKESLKFTLAKLFVSFSGVVLAARFVVSSGIGIATFMGIAPILIGAKLISIGTSLPELTLDLAAVRRGHTQLALGGIIGSNLTNLTLVLGLVLLASPFAVDITIFTELLPFLLVTTIIFWRFLNKGGVSIMGGIVLIMAYILFQAVISG